MALITNEDIEIVMKEANCSRSAAFGILFDAVIETGVSERHIRDLMNKKGYPREVALAILQSTNAANSITLSFQQLDRWCPKNCTLHPRT